MDALDEVKKLNESSMYDTMYISYGIYRRELTRLRQDLYMSQEANVRLRSIISRLREDLETYKLDHAQLEALGYLRALEGVKGVR